jgi:hypothetical protein
MNRFSTYVNGHTYVVTRRFLNRKTGSMRVRVVIYAGFTTDKNAIVHNEYRDYDDVHAGDASFIKQVKWARSLASK